MLPVICVSINILSRQSMRSSGRTATGVRGAGLATCSCHPAFFASSLLGCGSFISLWTQEQVRAQIECASEQCQTWWHGCFEPSRRMQGVLRLARENRLRQLWPFWSRPFERTSSWVFVLLKYKSNINTRLQASILSESCLGCRAI